MNLMTLLSPGNLSWSFLNILPILPTSQKKQIELFSGPAPQRETFFAPLEELSSDSWAMARHREDSRCCFVEVIPGKSDPKPTDTNRILLFLN